MEYRIKELADMGWLLFFRKTDDCDRNCARDVLWILKSIWSFICKSRFQPHLSHENNKSRRYHR